MIQEGVFMNLNDLSEKDRKKPYAGLLNRPMAQPSKEALAFLEKRQPMPKDKVMLPENGNMNDILKDGYLAYEYGYCPLDNGGGYVAMLTKMPGVTFDMYNFWIQWWSGKEDSSLRYCIWNPRDHYRAGFRWSCEKIGAHIEDLIFLETMGAETLGFDKAALEKSGLLLADGGNVISKAVDAAPLSAPMPGVVMHFIREMADGSGIEMRSRFWKGYQIGPEGLVCMTGPDTPRETEESLWGLAEHNAVEMANLAAILPELYAMERYTVETAG